MKHLLVLAVLLVVASSRSTMRRNSGPGLLAAAPRQPMQALPSSAVVPFTYPLYMQCDPIWGNDFMNGSTSGRRLLVVDQT